MKRTLTRLSPIIVLFAIGCGGGAGHISDTLGSSETDPPLTTPDDAGHQVDAAPGLPEAAATVPTPEAGSPVSLPEAGSGVDGGHEAAAPGEDAGTAEAAVAEAASPVEAAGPVTDPSNTDPDCNPTHQAYGNCGSVSNNGPTGTNCDSLNTVQPGGGLTGPIYVGNVCPCKCFVKSDGSPSELALYTCNSHSCACVDAPATYTTFKADTCVIDQ